MKLKKRLKRYIQRYRQYNKNIIKLSMSKCHFPHDNYTIILDIPSISHINNTLRLIETNNHLPDHSLLSLAYIDKPHHQEITYDLLHDDDEQDSLGMTIQDRVEFDQGDPALKKKKTGCTCKKTNCIKMYCQCFSVGKMCTPECACYGCYNHSEHESILQKAKQQLKSRSYGSNRHSHRGCNCKKTNCQKKYCQCYNAGMACTQMCNCCDCCNKEDRQGCEESSMQQVP